jgi:hypothetical protein
MASKFALALALSAVCAPALAVTSWTNWTSATAGEPGSAAGTLDGIAVTYSGEVLSNFIINGSFASGWAPATTYIGGTVDTSPASVGDMITLNGSTLTNTLTFATPITNPVFAIWSLGQPGLAASFTFNATPVFEVGGPNSSFGGSAIKVNGNTVSGNEGNGIVQFNGTFSSITFTSTAENYYGFTVGQNITSTVPAIPEPQTWLLMLAGLAAVGAAAKRRSTR